MVMNFFIRNKRGSEMILPPTIFIILNVVFFGILLLFIVKASTGAFVYEQVYAKQVALLIDEAKSDMQILVDFEEGVKVAEKNKKKSNLIGLDKEENKVIVNLGSKGGYAYKYFSDYEVNVYDHVEENLIIINVGDKIWPDISRPVDFDKEVSEGDLKEIVSKNCADYSEFIFNYSEKYEVNPLLVLAIIMQESNCNPVAWSGSSIGLMQINVGVHKGTKGLSSDVEESKEQLKDPETNIRVGVEILKEYYNYKESTYQNKIKATCKDPIYQEKYLSYEGWDSALRLYNGPGCLPPGANVNYVEEVIERYVIFGGELDVV